MPYERFWQHQRGGQRKNWLIADLGPEHAVQVTCTKCSHRSMVAPHELHARHKASVNLGALKLRCAACGGREVSWEVLVARPPRDARAY